MPYGGPPQPNSSEAVRQLIITEVRKHVEEAITATQNNILSEIQTTISQAVEARYKVIVAQVGADKKDKDSRTWQIVLAALPILLTVGLGWWITKSQTEITRKIDDQKQDLTTRLALTQEYQKRKLDVYQSCAKNISTLSESLEALRIEPNDQKQASDALHDLYDCSQNNPLYVTKDLAALLTTVQTDAIEIMQKAGKDQVNTTAFEHDIGAAEKQMLDELTGVTVSLNPSQ